MKPSTVGKRRFKWWWWKTPNNMPAQTYPQNIHIQVYLKDVRQRHSYFHGREQISPQEKSELNRKELWQGAKVATKRLAHIFGWVYTE